MRNLAPAQALPATPTGRSSSLTRPGSLPPFAPGRLGPLYPDLNGVEWIPSDDADVFRLSFTSGREPRILKMATHGNHAVWREIGAFPAMRRLGIPEVLEFEHTSDDLPDLGIEFHVTRELVNPEQASRAMADLKGGQLWASGAGRQAGEVGSDRVSQIGQGRRPVVGSISSWAACQASSAGCEAPSRNEKLE